MKGTGPLSGRLGPLSIELLESFPPLKAINSFDPAYVRNIVEAVESAREYKEKYIMPNALEVDRRAGDTSGYVDWRLIRAALPYGLLSIIVPRQLGGRGGLLVMGCLVMEELCSGCAGLANIFGAHMLGIAPTMLSGSLVHIDRYLYQIAQAEKNGEPIIMGFAITEPSAGTDAEEPHFLALGRTDSEARPTSGGYLLNGTKCFISNGSIARYLTVYMPVERNRRLETWTCFVVDTKREGFSVGRVEHKMGQRACPAAEIRFSNYFVPREDVVGDAGEGMEPQTLVVLGASRGPVGAIATGIARGALDTFRRWAERRSGNRRPADEETIRTAIAEMTARLSAARSLYLSAALTLEFGGPGRLLRHPLVRGILALPVSFRTSNPYTGLMLSRQGKNAVKFLMRSVMDGSELTRALALSSMAKSVCSDTAMFITRRCLELLGTSDAPERPLLQKCFRDAKLTQIYEGTNQLNMLTAYMALYSGELKIDLPRPGSRRI
mgnify:CR=1 FL=1